MSLPKLAEDIPNITNLREKDKPIEFDSTASQDQITASPLVCRSPTSFQDVSRAQPLKPSLAASEPSLRTASATTIRDEYEYSRAETSRQRRLAETSHADSTQARSEPISHASVEPDPSSEVGSADADDRSTKCTKQRKLVDLRIPTRSSSRLVRPPTRARKEDLDAESQASPTPTPRAIGARPPAQPPISRIIGPPLQPADPKPNVHFRYYVVSSRVPVYNARQWTPKKKYTNMSLNEFQDEMSHYLPAYATGWHFTISGPGVCIRLHVCRDNEGDHVAMKSYVAKRLRLAIDQNRKNVHLVIEFEIEMLRDGATMVEEVD
ncbi:hypothetical protein S40288_11532 [Stachybotrys chartarum IBT 40288]|nr:hypothetical protein S40288_11532 [Stachybotrys chartarum IBT 40288]